MDAPVYLCIDCYRVQVGGVDYFTHAHAKINAGDGTSFGSLQMLDDREVKHYAKWCGIFGGRALLDALELELINCGMLWVWPDDEAPEAVEVDEWEALEIIHTDTGLQILWEPRKTCHVCDGTGQIDDGYQDDPWDSECPNCCGGKVGGAPVLTDLDGTILHDGASA